MEPSSWSWVEWVIVGLVGFFLYASCGALFLRIFTTKTPCAGFAYLEPWNKTYSVECGWKTTVGRVLCDPCYQRRWAKNAAFVWPFALGVILGWQVVKSLFVLPTKKLVSAIAKER